MKTQVDLSQLAIEREAAPASVHRRRHVVSRYVVPAVLVAGFAALVAWAARDYVVPPQRVTVVPVLATTAEVQQGGTPLFKAAGWIEPRPTPIRVAALAPGVVKELLVVEDQPVAAGEPVAELIREDAQLARDRAEADLRLQKAALAEAKAAQHAATTRFEQPVHLEAALQEAEASLARVETELKNLPHATRRAEADLEFARSDYQGKQSAQGAVAGRIVDQARSALDSAQALVEELRERRASLQHERAALVQRRNALQTQLSLLADETQARDVTAAQVAGAAARVEQARVALAEAELRLSRMTVRAPIDGRVYQLVAYPGSTLSGGMGPDNTDGSSVVTLYRPDMLQVRVDVRFEDLPQVALGQPVEIDNPALSEPLAGHVLYVSSEADIQKNTLEVKVAIDSPPPVFKPEMLVDVTFLAPEAAADAPTTAREETRIFAPRQLVHQDSAGSFVWLADQSRHVARRTPVEPGEATADGLVRIPSGLSVSSRLIATGHEGLADGDRIRVTGEQAAAGAASPGASGRRALSRLPRGGTE